MSYDEPEILDSRGPAGSGPPSRAGFRVPRSAALVLAGFLAGILGAGSVAVALERPGTAGPSARVPVAAAGLGADGVGTGEAGGTAVGTGGAPTGVVPLAPCGSGVTKGAVDIDPGFSGSGAGGFPSPPDLPPGVMSGTTGAGTAWAPGTGSTVSAAGAAAPNPGPLATATAAPDEPVTTDAPAPTRSPLPKSSAFPGSAAPTRSAAPTTAPDCVPPPAPVLCCAPGAACSFPQGVEVMPCAGGGSGSACAGTASAAPGSVGPGTPVPAPPPTEQVTGGGAKIGEQDAGRTFVVQPGTELAVVLGGPGWSAIRSDSPAVVPTNSSDGFSEFRAARDGTAHLAATYDPPCRPACGAPSRSWTVTVIVRG